MGPAEDLLVAEDLSVAFGGVKALSIDEIRVPLGGMVGIVGPNGAGKTTLLNVISGFVSPSSGHLRLGDVDLLGLSTKQRVDLGIVRSFQAFRLIEDATVRTNILIGTQRNRRATLIEQIVNSPRHFRKERADSEATTSVARDLGLGGVMTKDVSSIPFPLRRLTEIARVLVSEPQIVLLDEPAAGLDERSRFVLGDVLQDRGTRDGRTTILVEHDVGFVQRYCRYLFVLDFGSVIAAGEPQDVLRRDAVRHAYFGGGSRA